MQYEESRGRLVELFSPKKENKNIMILWIHRPKWLASGRFSVLTTPGMLLTPWQSRRGTGNPCSSGASLEPGSPATQRTPYSQGLQRVAVACDFTYLGQQGALWLTAHPIWSYSLFSFPGGSDGKESACNVGDLDLILGRGKSGHKEVYGLRHGIDRMTGKRLKWCLAQ